MLCLPDLACYILVSLGCPDVVLRDYITFACVHGPTDGNHRAHNSTHYISEY